MWEPEQEGLARGVVKVFDVGDPRGAGSSLKKGTFDVNIAWELLRQDVLYLDWNARQNVNAIVNGHDKVGFLLHLVGSSICVVFSDGFNWDLLASCLDDHTSASSFANRNVLGYTELEQWPCSRSLKC
uniref:Uncharacterized protein n=1 Tax=Physcomitrium patens TaxID=3218 RepID=A0A2K1IE48_PHYPA|nr:hypothetical protein PHYPA_029706 [Physcomitrium patens]